jgi:hypothetical protein
MTNKAIGKVEILWITVFLCGSENCIKHDKKVSTTQAEEINFLRSIPTQGVY